MYRILVFFVLLTAGVLKAQIPTSSLVSSWPFTGNANDVISSNNGTVTGASLTTDRCGNPNSAYLFNGSSDYILTSTGGVTGAAARSISFWTKTTYTSTSPVCVIGYGATGSPGVAFGLQFNYNCLGIGVDVNNQALTRGSQCLLLNNQWHHIVCVVDPNVGTSIANMLFYVDGSVLSTITCTVAGQTQTLNTGSTYPFTFGRVHDNFSRYYPGALDDILYYNRALTATEVVQIYTTSICNPPIFGNPIPCTSVTTVYSVSPYSNASYTWSLPSGWTGSSSTNTISVTPGTNPGVITVSASSASCGILPTSTLNVSLYSANNLTVTSSSPTICAGSAVTLNVSGATTYTWSTLSTGSTVVVSPSVTTTYTINATSVPGCITTKTVVQTVVGNPTLSVSGPTSICNGVATLTASGATSYTWLPGSTHQNTVGPILSPGANYTVSGTLNGCSSAIVGTFSVPAALMMNVSQSSASVCLGGSISHTANASGGSGAYNYTWQPAGSVGSVMVNAQGNAGSYVQTLTLLDGSGCALTQTLMDQFVLDAMVTVADASVCPNTSSVITASGCLTYTWQPTATIGSTQTVSGAGPYSYTVVGTTAMGCTAMATSSVFVKPAPALSFQTASITCAHLGFATVTATGIGPFVYTWTPTNQSGAAASNLFPGTYTVSVNDLGTGCLFTPTVSFSPLVPLTATVNPIDSLKCYGANTASASLVLSGGSGNQNYLWSGSSGTQTGSVAQNLTAGDYTVLVTDALTFCTVTKTLSVLQPPQLVISLSSSSPSTCVGGIVTLSAQVSGGTGVYTYSWAPSLVSFTMPVSQPSGGTTIYQFFSADAYSCTTSETISINHVPYPIVGVTDVTLCPLETGVLTATGATTYTWNTGAGSPNLPVSLPATTQFTVTGSTAGCSTSVTASAFIKPAPVPAPFSNSPLCERDTLLLGTASTGTFVWTGPQFFSSSQQTIGMANAVPAQTGIYNLTVSAANGCTASASLPVIVNPVPVVPVWSGTVCAGQSLNLLSGFFPNTAYKWTGPASYTSSLQNNSISNSDTTMSGQYTLVTTSTLSGCNTQTTINALIKNPVPVIISANSPLCPGKILTLGTSGTSVWWTGPGNVVSNQPTVSVGSVIASGQYSLQVTQGPCIFDTIVSVLVFPFPHATIAGDSIQFFCEGMPMQLSGSSVPSASSYTWQGNSQFSNTSLLNLGPASLTATGVYSLFVTDINGCVGLDSVLALVHPRPQAVAKGDTVCIGMPGYLSAGGGSTYSWSGPGGFSASSASVMISPVTTTNGGIYSVQVIDSNQCTATATAVLLANAFPLPAPGITKSPLKACINSPVTLVGTGGVSYLWSGPHAFTSADSIATVLITDSTFAGIYTLSVKDDKHCAGTGTINVPVFAQPTASLHLSSNYQCVPFCTDIVLDQSGNVTGPLSAIKVQLSPTQIDTSLKLHCFVDPGPHPISVFYNDSNGCVNSSSVTLVGLAKPDAAFSYHPQDPKVNEELVRFYNHSDCYDCQFTWLLGLRGDTSYLREPSYVFPLPGSQVVTLLVTTTEGCVDTVTMPVHVEDEFTLYVPNSFSPNGDGLNDIFAAKGQGIDELSMQVFDRWGQLIFKSEKITDGWDGTYKGKSCQTDVYNWTLRVKAEKRVKNYTGFVNLLR